eukprot:Mycagemm_TRINITY_DN10319_c0_g2::TRINITY_DN10319_c0_g2_i1::g.663::m.663 type:complete len:137 gc:universal TRINITY_DN10319_c0_g2_i1:455-45(-)
MGESVSQKAIVGMLTYDESRGVATSKRGGASVMSKLEDSALAIGAGRAHHNVGGVLNGSNDAGGEHELLPGLAKIQQVDAISAALPDVAVHLGDDVLGANVHLSDKHLLEILLAESQSSGYLTHLVCNVTRRVGQA